MSSYTYGYGNTYGFSGYGGSVVLAQIIYNMDTFNVTDADLRTLDNSGSEGIYSDAPMYASNHIFLDGSTQSVDYPIPHTLGSEEGTNGYTNNEFGGVVSTLTNATEDGYTLDITTAGTNSTYPRPYCEDVNTSYSIGDIILCTFDLEVVSGSIELGAFTDRFNIIMQTISTKYSITTTGSYEMYGVVIADGTFTGIELHHNGTLVGKCIVSNISYKQITNPNSYLTYFDTTAKSHVTVDNSIAPSTIYTQEDSHSNTFTTTQEVLSADLIYLDANPESTARLIDGETVSGLSFDLTDIEAFYPANEGEASGAFVQDVMTDLGSDRYSDIEPASVNLTITPITNGKNILWNVTSSSTGNSMRFVSTNSDFSTPNQLQFTATINNGTLVFDRYFNGITYVSLEYEHTVVNGVNILLIPPTTDTKFYLTPKDVTIGLDIDFTFNTIKETTASEIINYASTCRTNLDLTNYGASNLLYKQDATGRWLSMADANLIEFTGDGRYADTEWIPSDADIFTIEAVFINKLDGITWYSGVTEGVDNLRYGSDGAGNINIMIGDKSTWTSKTTGALHHVALVYDGTNASQYIDGTQVLSPIATSFTSIVDSFTIGGRNSSAGVTTFMETVNGLFKVHKNKAMTADEVASAYTQAKLIHPTLP